MIRAIAIAAAFAAAAAAQTPSPDAAPITVSGRIDSTTGTPKLVESVQNTTTRAIRGFAYVTTFTEPETGKVISTWNRACVRIDSNPALNPGPGVPVPSGCKNGLPSQGLVIASGAGPEPIGRPLSVPTTSSGAAANYTFTVDLVVFTDGTTWGPAKTGPAKVILLRLNAQNAQ